MIIGLSRFVGNLSTIRNATKAPVLPSFKINPQAIETPIPEYLDQVPYEDYKTMLDLKSSCEKQARCRYFAVEYKNRIYHVFNAYYYPMGRMIHKISTLIRGKSSPHYRNSVANIKNGDKCIIVNASDPLLTGKKLIFKNLKYHTGFVGHLRTHEYRAILNKKPELLYFYMLRKAMPKNKISEKYLQNLKIFRGPVHNIANLPQFAPNPSIVSPLTNTDLLEAIKESNEELKLMHSNMEIDQIKEIMGQNLTYDKNEEDLNDSLETDKMTGREGERKVVNVLKGEKRAKFQRKRQRLLDRYTPVRAPYKNKEKIDPGFEYFDSEKKAKKSKYYQDLANEDMQEADDEKIDDPFKRKGFDKDL